MFDREQESTSFPVSDVTGLGDRAGVDNGLIRLLVKFLDVVQEKRVLNSLYFG